MTDTIDVLADFVAATTGADLPEEAVAAAKDLLLDSLGVGLAGSAGPYVNALTAAERALHDESGACRILGQRICLPAQSAALLNSYQMHNSEFDCIHEKAVVHPMTVLLGTALAHADRVGALGTKIGGPELIRAIVLGVEIGCTLGIAATSPLQFFRPATAGLFAAVSALAVLRGDDAATLKRAYGLAYAQLSGSMQAHAEGSALLALQMGLSARNAIVASEMARNGMPGLDGVLEGRFGYFGSIEREGDIGTAAGTLGRPWKITQVAHKPFPSGRATHGVIEAALTLVREERLEAGEISGVTARIPSLTNTLVGRPITPSMDINYARLNARFCLATIFMTGGIDLAEFSEQAFRDPDRLAMAGKIDIEVDDNPDPNALSPVQLEVELMDGRKLARSVTTVYGAPGNPMSEQAKLEKFMRNTETAAYPVPEDRARAAIAMVGTLETVPDIRDLITALHGN